MASTRCSSGWPQGPPQLASKQGHVVVQLQPHQVVSSASCGEASLALQLWPIGTTCCLLATCAHNQAVSDQHLELMMIFVTTAATLVIYHISIVTT